MKGIILAGGKGTRLMPITSYMNKHMIPVYNQPMVYWPLKTLVDSGIKDILLISSRDHAGQFLQYFDNGKRFGCNMQYGIQEEATGIAGALSLAEDFAKNSKIAVMLGDNMFGEIFNKDVKIYSRQGVGAKVFLKRVANPHAYGIAHVKKGVITKIVEKPKSKKRDLAVTGLYFYDQQVFDIIKKMKPSKRGELEITDVNNWYIKNSKIEYKTLERFWGDAGEDFISLIKAQSLIYENIQDKKATELFAQEEAKKNNI